MKQHPLSRDLCDPHQGQRFVVNDREWTMGGALGDGAVGVVRRASPVGSSTIAAVKFLAPDPKYIDVAVFDDVRQRFRREGERGVRLRHDHLVEIMAYCENERGSAFLQSGPTNPFILMDFVRGRTLESYILRLPQQGVFDLTRQKLSIAIQLANALDYLRNHRLIHRDVKPANVFLSRPKQSATCWTVRLGDFGVMKWGDFQASIETGTLTVTSQRGLGTLKYMSPEQAVRPKDVTVKSDIYSLGITLYELFTGQVLASAHHVYEVANARRSRGNTVSRFFSMGFHLRSEDEPIGELLLDMFLAPSGRPPIDHIRGRLEWEYERRFGAEWEYDLY